MASEKETAAKNCVKAIEHDKKERTITAVFTYSEVEKETDKTFQLTFVSADLIGLTEENSTHKLKIEVSRKKTTTAKKNRFVL